MLSLCITDRSSNICALNKGQFCRDYYWSGGKYRGFPIPSFADNLELFLSLVLNTPKQWR